MKNVIHTSTVVTDFFVAKTGVLMPCIATTSTNGLKQALHFIKFLKIIKFKLSSIKLAWIFCEIVKFFFNAYIRQTRTSVTVSYKERWVS